MSQENVELARRAMRAFAEKDVETWVGCFDAGVEMFLPRNVLEGGSYRGHDGVRRAFVDAYETWEAFDFDFDLEEARTIDDHVVLLGRSTNVGKGDSPTVEYQSAALFEVCEGKIVYFRPYQSYDEALEAVGLSE